MFETKRWKENEGGGGGGSERLCCEGAYLCITQRKYECPMWSSSAVDVGSANEKEEEAVEEEGDQDEFLTGRHRLPFSLDNDEETNPDLDNSDDEKEE